MILVLIVLLGLAIASQVENTTLATSYSKRSTTTTAYQHTIFPTTIGDVVTIHDTLFTSPYLEECAELMRADEAELLPRADELAPCILATVDHFRTFEPERDTTATPVHYGTIKQARLTSGMPSTDTGGSSSTMLNHPDTCQAPLLVKKKHFIQETSNIRVEYREDADQPPCGTVALENTLQPLVWHTLDGRSCSMGALAIQEHILLVTKNGTMFAGLKWTLAGDNKLCPCTGSYASMGTNGVRAMIKCLANRSRIAAKEGDQRTLRAANAVAEDFVTVVAYFWDRVEIEIAQYWSDASSEDEVTVKSRVLAAIVWRGINFMGQMLIAVDQWRNSAVSEA